MTNDKTTPRPSSGRMSPTPIPLLSRMPASGIVAIGLIAWLVLSALFVYPIIGDPSLARRGDDYWEFSQWFGSSAPYPHTSFGPLYPLFIRLMRELGLSVVTFIALQKALVLVSGYLIYRLGRHFGLGTVLAAMAGAAYIAYPITQAESSLLFTETFYLTLLLGALVCLLPALDLRQGAAFGPLLAGFSLLGLAALARGNGLIVFAALGLFALTRCPWREVIAAGVIGALPVLLWSALNYQWYGHFKPTSSGDFNIAALIVGPVYLEQEGKSEDTWPDVWIDGQWHDHFSNPFEYTKFVRNQAVDYAIDHPLPVVIGNVTGWFRSLLGPARQDFILLFGPKGDIFTALSAAIRALLLLGLGAYVLTGAWSRQPTFSLLMVVILLAHIPPAGAAGFARFGFPVDAFSTLALALAIAAAMGTRSARNVGSAAGRGPSSPGAPTY